MKKTKEFNNILDNCLERLLVKGETIEQCLQSYPEHASELEPLLQTAMATKKALAVQDRPQRWEIRVCARDRGTLATGEYLPGIEQRDQTKHE